MSNRTIGIIILILLIIMGGFAYMNRQMIIDSQEAYENAEIIIKSNEFETKMSFEDIVQLGEKEFTAILDTSDTEPEKHSYTGILLINIIEKAGIDIVDKKQVIVKAIDGYTIGLTMQEVMAKDNIYLTYKLNGKYLKSKDEGGSGPYQIIVRQDDFSQRWCKFVVEIEIK